MKCYYYGPPSSGLLRAAHAAKNKAKWLRFPAVAAIVACWAALMPAAWLLVKAGEIGHSAAGWCGFDSRDW